MLKRPRPDIFHPISRRVIHHRALDEREIEQRLGVAKFPKHRVIGAAVDQPRLEHIVAEDAAARERRDARPRAQRLPSDRRVRARLKHSMRPARAHRLEV